MDAEDFEDENFEDHEHTTNLYWQLNISKDVQQFSSINFLLEPICLGKCDQTNFELMAENTSDPVGDIKISQYAISLRAYLINLKLQDHEIVEQFMTPLMFVQLHYDIMKKYPSLVENMHCVTGVIDGIFENETQSFMKKQFLFYTIGYLLPFILQRFFVTSHTWVIALNISSLIV